MAGLRDCISAGSGGLGCSTRKARGQQQNERELEKRTVQPSVVDRGPVLDACERAGNGGEIKQDEGREQQDVDPDDDYRAVVRALARWSLQGELVHP